MFHNYLQPVAFMKERLPFQMFLTSWGLNVEVIYPKSYQDKIRKSFYFASFQAQHNRARHTNLFGLAGNQEISPLIQSSSQNYCFWVRVLMVGDIWAAMCVYVCCCCFPLILSPLKVKCKYILHCSKSRHQNCSGSKFLPLYSWSAEAQQKLGGGEKKKKKKCGGRRAGCFHL